MSDLAAPAESLFTLAGGRAGVDAIVEGFYRRIAPDPHMRPIYPEDLEPGKAKLKLFFEQWLGGEPAYSQRFGHPRLRRRHFPFVIDELAAGRWLRYMREAMAEQGVPRAALDVIFARLGPLAHHMVNANEEVPRAPLGDAVLE